MKCAARILIFVVAVGGCSSGAEPARTAVLAQEAQVPVPAAPRQSDLEGESTSPPPATETLMRGAGSRALSAEEAVPPIVTPGFLAAVASLTESLVLLRGREGSVTSRRATLLTRMGALSLTSPRGHLPKAEYESLCRTALEGAGFVFDDDPALHDEARRALAEVELLDQGIAAHFRASAEYQQILDASVGALRSMRRKLPEAGPTEVLATSIKLGMKELVGWGMPAEAAEAALHDAAVLEGMEADCWPRMT